MNRLLYPLAFQKQTDPVPCPHAAQEVPPLLHAHHLLPMWEEFAAALARIGPVLQVTRNAHAVLGGMGCGPALTGRGRGDESYALRYDFRHWHRGWYAGEELHGGWLEGFAIADSERLGFLKYIPVSEPEHPDVQTIRRAFENGMLHDEELEDVVHANHLDSACCPDCERRALTDQPAGLERLAEFIALAARSGRVLRVNVPHPGCTAVREFIPQRMEHQGLWLCCAGRGTSLFLRTSGIASLQWNLHTTDAGPQRSVVLRDEIGTTFATLISAVI